MLQYKILSTVNKNCPNETRQFHGLQKKKRSKNQYVVDDDDDERKLVEHAYTDK
jgi:hypothetical protein